jgi:hypothetical protein
MDLGFLLIGYCQLTYMMSSAFTKNVQTKGRIKVRYSKCAAIAKIKAAVDAKNRIQYKNLEAPLAIW